MQPNALPISLRSHPQWLCWARKERDGKATKVPIGPKTGAFASTADEETFEEALAAATRDDITGIGFVFTADDSYVGIDLDGCREAETGVLNDEAVEIITRLHSTTEVSPSGTGLHIIATGELPGGARRRGSVEMNDESRFFTMTGMHLYGTPQTVCHRSKAIRRVHDAFVAGPSTDEAERVGTPEPNRHETHPNAVLTDDQLVQKASFAANGQKFMRLWEGSTNGYESHSEADMALCCLLAFWTGGDRVRMDSLFRSSGLYRQKWDEVHYADGATYGERTVERACGQVTEYYELPNE